MLNSTRLAEEIAQVKIKQYTDGLVTLENLLQSIEKVEDTEENLWEVNRHDIV